MKKRDTTVLVESNGPTSIFVAGKREEDVFFERRENTKEEKERRKIEQQIVANPHTLEEVIAYIKEKYGAEDKGEQAINYLEYRSCWKESLIMEYRPELLEGLAEFPSLKSRDEKEFQKFLNRVELFRKKVEEISDEEFPMDFHIYEIQIPEVGMLQVAIEKVWEKFGVSYNGKPELREIVKEIYLYYGVSKQDISEKSERYEELVRQLSC